MHVLSVVFVFATLAIFVANGKVQNCQVKCEEPTDPKNELCAEIDGKEFTMNLCEYNNFTSCLTTKIQDSGLRVKIAHFGACDLPSVDTCETYCGDQKLQPVCGEVWGVKRNFSNVCTFLNNANCNKADAGESIETHILNFGEC